MNTSNRDDSLKLDDNHRITTSDRNVVLEKYVAPVEKTMRVSKDSPRIGTGEFTKGYWDVMGFYRTHRAAVDAWVDSELREAPQSIALLLKKVDELHGIIKEVFND